MSPAEKHLWEWLRWLLGMLDPRWAEWGATRCVGGEISENAGCIWSTGNGTDASWRFARQRTCPQAGAACG